MNRFRTKKKTKEDTAAPRPSVESDSSHPFRMFGKKKAAEEEPKQNLDLATALPSSDDFRTSLLMNGLSARFSMLREQDDPNSKIGKASDDSVLFPKRQSRLDMFGAGLHDIAEVESIRAPPFLRQDSMHSDDAASTSGSIMNRSKPTEGNVLFGGRQKIYKITPGGSGRALYDDDVAQSAFQKWRQSEKERSSLEGDENHNGDGDEPSRAESPAQLDFNRRRETSSTTSSGPSGARNSTAATSVTSSHPNAALKEWQSATNLQGSASTSNIPERTVTRTRRLYEQGLTQELQDSQNSALSRFDSISKQRHFGVRSPDLSFGTPSPTSSMFSDRRPGMLSKASAPNLRSFTPPVTGSAQLSPAESSGRFPAADLKANFGSSPPLSPPVSETEEPMLAIQPNDLGKATAMGVFSRPTQQYDDSKFNQRQRQLQQGRETPTSRFRAESNGSLPASRSQSAASLNRLPVEKPEPAVIRTEPTVPEELPRTTFLDDSDAEPASPLSTRLSKDKIATPRLTLERPNDQDHPALRRSAIPTPLTLASLDPSPTVGGESEGSRSASRNISPEDSPTLGPNTGLSGMVRQHLRSDSGASSVYGAYDGNDNEKRFSHYTSANVLESMDAVSNTWNYVDQENPDPYASDELSPPPAPRSKAVVSPSLVTDAGNPQAADLAETDDFARHLADGARRVRERLTSYVDPDGQGLNLSDLPSDLQPPQRPTTGSSLRTKSSVGSIRHKESRDRSQTRAKKLLGIGSSTMTSAPSPTRPTSNGQDSIVRGHDAEDHVASREAPTSPSDRDDKDEPVHAGLKAFRQARRELQRMKELETKQRRQPPPSQPTAATPARERAPAQRAPSQERGQPPVSYRSRMHSDEFRSNAGSRAPSQASTERDRSGSEASNGRANSRPPRLRNINTSAEEHFRSASPSLGVDSNGNRHAVKGRSPALMPHGSASSPRQQRGHDIPERSPGLPVSPRPGANTSFGGPLVKRPTAQGANSEPLLDTIGSQAAPRTGEPHQLTKARSVNQLNAASSTPNLHGSAAAPPLPPINPRRKNTATGTRRPQEYEEGHLPLSPGKGNSGRMMPSYDDGYMEKGTGRGRMANYSPSRNGRVPTQPPNVSAGNNIPGGMF